MFFITCWRGGKTVEVTLAGDKTTGPVLCKVCEGSSCLRQPCLNVHFPRSSATEWIWNWQTELVALLSVAL